MQHVPIRDLKDRLSEYLRLVSEGEEIVITLHKRPIAKLVPMGEAPEGEAERIARLNSQPWIRAGNGKAPQGSRNTQTRCRATLRASRTAPDSFKTS